MSEIADGWWIFTMSSALPLQQLRLVVRIILLAGVSVFGSMVAQLDGEEEDDGYLGEDHSFTAEDQDDDQNWEAEMEEDAMRIAGEIIHSTANRGGNSEEGKDDSSDVEEGEAEEEMERGDAVGDDMVVVITDENNDDYDDNNDDDDDDEDNNDDKGIKERRIDNKGKSEGEKSEMDEGEEVEEGEDLDKGKELEEGEEHENGEEEDGENDETSKPADMSISDQLVEDVKWAGTSQGGSAVITPAQAIAPVLTQNQMELLELEMRARAIKAMLMKQGPS